MSLRSNLLQISSLRNSVSDNDEFFGFPSDYSTEIRFKLSTLKSYVLGGSGSGLFLKKDGSESLTGNLTIEPTWNSSPTTFTGLKLNATDTNSDSGSLLFDLQKDSISVFNVDKVGTLNINGEDVISQDGGIVTLGNPNININVGSGISLNNTDSSIVNAQVISEFAFNNSDASTNLSGQIAYIRHIAEGDFTSFANGAITFGTSYNVRPAVLTEKVRISANGNLGIGTSSPLAKLHVSKTSSGNALSVNTVAAFTNDGTTANAEISILSRSSYHSIINLGNNTDEDYNSIIANNSGSSTAHLKFKVGGTDNILYLKKAGNIGIGTESPVSRLDVVDAGKSVITWSSISDTISNASFRLKGSNDINGYGLFMGYANVSNNAQGIQAGRESNGTAVPLLLNPHGGNVGIGTIAPLKTFHVDGTLMFENVLTSSPVVADEVWSNNGNLRIGISEKPALSGTEPASINSDRGESIDIEASEWFTGDVEEYESSLPYGLEIDPITGRIFGKIDGIAESSSGSIRAYNHGEFIEHSFDWYINWSLDLAKQEAKGWYDTKDPSTLKTDLAASFDAASSEILFITDTDETDLNTVSDITISIWVKVSVDGSTRPILGNWNGSGYILGKTASNLFYFVVGGLTLVSTSSATGGWQYLRATLEGGTAKLFVGDAEEASGAISGNRSTSSTWRLGFNNGNYYNGEMGHVALWNRALTASEITTLYKGGVMQYIPISLSPGGVSYWPLNEPRGTRYDRWGSNHLTDNNTVGAAHGPVELEADEYAGITKWENQGLSADEFSAFSLQDGPNDSIQLVNDQLVWDQNGQKYQATGTLNQPDTMFLVTQLDNTISNVLVDGLEVEKRRVFYSTGAGNFAAVANSQLNFGSSDTNRHIIFIEFNGLKSSIIIDGQRVDGSLGSEDDCIGLILGETYSGGAPFNGKIETLILFDRKLTQVEKDSLSSYYEPEATGSQLTVSENNFSEVTMLANGLWVRERDENVEVSNDNGKTWGKFYVPLQSLDNAPSVVKILTGLENKIDTSSWFDGDVIHYGMNIPNNFDYDALTGEVVGSFATEKIESVDIRANNGPNYIDHTTSFEGWDVLTEAKGWYDMKSETLKTDVVANFVRANGEYLFNSNPSFDLSGDFSFSFWVNFGDTASDLQWVFYNGGGSTSDTGISMRREASGVININVSNGSSVSVLLTSGSAVSQSEWHQFVLKREGGNASLYLNNEKIDTNVDYTVDLSNTGTFVIGGFQSSGAHPLNAEVSHFSFWERALSDFEIRDIYNGGSISHIPDSAQEGVSYWPLNEPRGVRYDRWGSNHLTDNNTVGAVHGPVELEVDEYAGVTRWQNQGLTSDPFNDLLSSGDASKAPQLINGVINFDGNDSFPLYDNTANFGTEYTMIAVGNFDPASSSTSYFVDAGGSSNRHLLYRATGSLRYFIGGASATTIGVDGEDRFVAVCEVQDGNTWSLKIGDTIGISTDEPVFSHAARIGIKVGSAFTGSNVMTGTVEAIVVIPRLLTDPERKSLEDYYNKAGKELHTSNFQPPAVFPSVSESAPSQVDVMGGAPIKIDVSDWFDGDVENYEMSIPDGMSYNHLTGVVSGTLPDYDMPNLVVQAHNGESYVSHTASWNVAWTLEKAKRAAKGWYDVSDPSTLKTDLVASFDYTNSESLRIVHGEMEGLDPGAHGAFTVAGWVNFTDDGRTECIFSRWNSTDSQLLFYKNSTGVWRMRVRDAANADKIIDSVPQADGNWHHVAGAWDGSVMRLYVDGVEEGSLAVADIDSYSSTTYIGSYNNGAGFLADGSMGHVAFWGRALTAAEVTTLYNGGTMQRIPDDLSVGGVSYWPLNEPRGVRYDRWGGNHLADINTVGAAHGPVEYQADEYAGVSSLENQGRANNLFGDLTNDSAGLAPTFIGGKLVYDGVSVGLVESGTSWGGDYTLVVVARLGSGAFLLDSDDVTKRHILGTSGSKLAYSEAGSNLNATLSSFAGASRFVSISSVSSGSPFSLSAGGEEAVSGGVATINPRGITLGSRIGLSQPMTGEVEAVIIIPGTLTAAEEASINTLLS